MEINKNNYVLITPAKNEEDNLPRLIKSIINQTIHPSLWLIINDKSIDSTKEIIEKTSIKYNWIKMITTRDTIEFLPQHLRYAEVCRTGFAAIKSIATNNEILYSYIGLSDADNSIDNNFFEFLMQKFQENPDLGVASGMPIFSEPHIFSRKPIKNNNYLPGGVRLWKRSCFNDTYGYLLTASPDTVSSVLALAHRWEIQTFEEVCFYPLRNFLSQVSTTLPYYEKTGFADYYMGKPVVFSMLIGIYNLFFNWPFIPSIWYMKGYMKGYLRKEPRIDNSEVLALFKQHITYNV